jgi:hypothetical protein
VWRAGQYHRYPEHFDDAGWTREMVVVPKVELDPIPQMYGALEAAPANVQLAARRAVRAVLRSDDEDETLDATIGIEALLLGNRDRDEMTHRMAQRAAAVLSLDGYEPTEVYRLIKKVYEHRSAIVHGRSRRRDGISLGGETYPAREIGVMLLRLLLMNWLLAETPWTSESLDRRILARLTAAT